MIRHVLAQPCVQDKRAVMVGDRDNDMHGAADCGQPAVGVLYGYGSRGSWNLCSAVSCAVAGALRAWLLQRKDQGEAALPEKGMTVFERYFCTFQNA